MKVLLVITNIQGHHDVPYHFGLSSISSYIKARGHDSEIMAIQTKDQYAAFQEKIATFRPRVIGFTVVSSQFGPVKELSGMAKNIDRNVLTICGGVHPTLYPEDLLAADSVDVFFRGESEIPFGLFLDKVEKGEDFRDTSNVVYRGDGTLVKNPLHPLLEQLDILPFPVKDSLFDECIKTSGYAPFFFSRGCPFTCSYCSNRALANVYGLSKNYPRYRSVDSCISEIKEALSKSTFRRLWIMDDTFGLNRKWREEFCEKYRSEISMEFFVLLRPNVVDEPLIKSLKDAGCCRIMFGLESGNDHVRNAIMKRNISRDHITNAFRLCRKYKIESVAFNIIGVPGETEEMIRDTINLNRKIHPTTSSADIFYPYRGTELGDKSFEDDLVDLRMYNQFSNERRETVLRYSEEHKNRLKYYQQNWDSLVYPYNLSRRMKALLRRNKPLYEFLRAIKRRIYKDTP